MFGYVTPEKPELKVREFDLFRGYYCGVCQEIKKKHSQLSRMALSYDCAFLAVLLDSLHQDVESQAMRNCMVHPMKKHLMLSGGKSLEYASDINVLLAYYQAKDKWLDDRSLKGLSAMWVMRRSAKRAGKKIPAIRDSVIHHLNELTQLEKNKCDSMDEAAEPFAGLMQDIFAEGGIGDNEKQVLGWMGYNLGKWIYLIDAADDLDDDIKTGSYNPILLQFPYDSNTQSVFQYKETVEENLRFVLMYTLSEVEKSLNLLDIRANRGILENIIYIGLITKTERILKGCKQENEKSV